MDESIAIDLFRRQLYQFDIKYQPPILVLLRAHRRLLIHFTIRFVGHWGIAVNENSRLMDMLTGYAAAHQHPVNIAVHMIGIPLIMFGALVALSWVSIDIRGVQLNAAWLLVAGFFVFYMTLDALFAIVFLIVSVCMTLLAVHVGQYDFGLSASIAAFAFFGGYIAQFIGHAIEKSQPVLLKHPIQAQLAAPFFTVVELFQLLGLRDELFNEVHRRIDEARAATPSES